MPMGFIGIGKKHTTFQRALKKHPVKTRVLKVSIEIDCGIGVVAARHGRFCQKPSSRIHTLHGEDLAHERSCVRFAYAVMSLRVLHGAYFITIKRLCKQRHFGGRMTPEGPKAEARSTMPE